MSTAGDSGLQPERTELAWRRTLLALAASALVSVRVLPEALGDWTVATGLGGVVVAAALWVLADRRHARIRLGFASALPMPGGALIAATAVFTSAGAALGLLQLAAVLLRSP